MALSLFVTTFEWDPSTETPSKEDRRLQEDHVKNQPYLVTFYETILVSRLTFQPTLGPKYCKTFDSSK